MSRPDQVQRTWNGRKARLFLGSLAVVSLAAAVTVVVRRAAAPPEPTRNRSAAFDPTASHNPDDPSQPLLLSGRLVSLEQAQNAWGRRLYRPNHPLASDGSIQQIWLSTEGAQELAIRYESGVRVYLVPWPAAQDPEGSYRDFVADTGYGSLGNLNGYPTLSIPEDVQAEDYPKASVVNVTIGRMEVQVHGHLSIDELTEIARTVF